MAPGACDGLRVVMGVKVARLCPGAEDRGAVKPGGDEVAGTQAVSWAG